MERTDFNGVSVEVSEQRRVVHASQGGLSIFDAGGVDIVLINEIADLAHELVDGLVATGVLDLDRIEEGDLPYR